LCFFTVPPAEAVLVCPTFVAILGAQATVFGVFLAFIYPAVAAYSQAHPNSLLDGILLYPPYIFFVPAALVSLLLMAARFVYLEFRDERRTARWPN
jgi:hypothetical protein